jgi:catechol 2,3-dioxygenase-like lactoylglutathione lyase family enzyme
VKAGAGLLTLLLAAGTAAEETTPPRIRGIAHVAFRAGDLAESRRFYEGFLGLQTFPATSGPAGSLVVRINERQTVELVPGLDPAEDRLDHLAFQVDDLDGARRALSARGIPVSPRGDSIEARDPEGHAIELVALSSVAPDGSATDAISRRLLHAGILVGALEETRGFYEKLGLRETWRGSRSGTELSWTNMQVPDGGDYVEFMLYSEIPAANHRGTEHHVCLEVPDVEAACRALRDRAASAGYARPLEVRVGINRRRQLNLYDPDGTRVELMEPRTVDGQPAPSSKAPPPRPR